MLRYILIGTLGALVFVLMQLVPQIYNHYFSPTAVQVMPREEAVQQAEQFVAETFGTRVTRTDVLHQTNRLLTGYLTKEQQLQTYMKDYGERYPLDTFQVDVYTNAVVYRVFVHMESGEISSWEQLQPPVSDAALPSEEEARAAAIAFATARGYDEGTLTLRDASEGDSSANGEVLLDVEGSMAVEAQLYLRMLPVLNANGSIEIVSFEPHFAVPSAYTTYVSSQDQLAEWGSLLSLGLSFILFVLSVVYAILYRKYSSFKRGLVLSLIFLLFYILNNISMMDGVRATWDSLMSTEEEIFLLSITALLSCLLALSTYFAFVAGDALWRSMGHKLWARFGEPGYGAHVWRSMKLGYLFALGLLGLQTILFILLGVFLGTWSTSDPASSPYNLEWAWLFPMIAWCAAIWEEAVYRLFGIGLLRKWFKNFFIVALPPSIIWALGHIAYPFYPASTRLIELIIIGLIFSYILMRFGLITAIFTHAIFNTVLMSIMLILLGEPLNIGAALFYLVLPLLVALIIRAVHNRRSKRQPVEPPQVGVLE